MLSFLSSRNPKERRSKRLSIGFPPRQENIPVSVTGVPAPGHGLLKSRGPLFPRHRVRPACTFIGVSRFVDPEWLVESEVDAVVSGKCRAGLRSPGWLG